MIKKPHLRRSFTAFVLVAVVGAAQVGVSQVPPPIPPPIFTIKNLGTLDGAGCQECASRAFDVNNFGQVVGISNSQPVLGRLLPFRTAPNQPISPTDVLGSPFGPFPLDREWRWRPYAINDAGQVAGWGGKTHPSAFVEDLAYEPDDNEDDPFSSFVGFDVGPRALLWDQAGVPLNLGGSAVCDSTLASSLGYASKAFGLNSNGAAAGWAVTFDPCERDPRQAARFSGGLITVFGTLIGSIRSQLRDINDSGRFVGSSRLSSNIHAFASTPSAGMVDLGTIDGCSLCGSIAYRINNADQVIGVSSRSIGFSVRISAFLMDLGVPAGHLPVMQDLGTLCAIAIADPCRSAAFDVNDLGWIVGQSEFDRDLDGVTHAFLYRHGTMTDLNTLLTPVEQAQWVLTDARGVNDFGQIVGTGVFQGAVRGYLMTLPLQFIFENVSQLSAFSLSSEPPGTLQSLLSNLQAAEASIERGNVRAAEEQLGAYEHQVRALVQSRRLTEIQGTRLLAGGTLIRRVMEEERRR